MLKYFQYYLARNSIILSKFSLNMDLECAGTTSRGEQLHEVSHSPPKRVKRTTVAESLKARSCDRLLTLCGSSVDHHAKDNVSSSISRQNGEHTKRDKSRDRTAGGKGDGGQSSRKNHHSVRSGAAGGGRSWGGIPDRWLQYQIGIGKPIANTRFLAFKTPLRPMFFEGRDFKELEEHRFEVDTVVSHVKSINKTLGLVIDLTNTDRYYDSKLWSNYEILYMKIRCPGHEVNGDEQFYNRFRGSVKQFIEQNEDNDKLIGVHCTHGLNRTGYLICRYLIEEHGWGAEKAVETFRQSRGYPMERAAYISSLKEAERRLAQLDVAEDEKKKKVSNSPPPADEDKKCDEVS